ncbi:inorganic pyrophosphatase [Listeria seeligeri]|uniref:inorganic pyrophosphatase n=1 Tax=Listeria seeligeri TaxID=1640 RepID=UPI001888C3C5|nr:inorganic pyrophosphatase [Listeria seeligeri]MBF2599193.1 inorganic pyrophosphatase [Listeria seeligeri]
MKMKKLKLKITVDRPIGYTDEFGNIYPINYGFVSGIIGGDDEEQDVYIISSKVDKPLKSFTGELIAVITRKDDVEGKWVVTSKEEQLTLEEIKNTVHFIEQYFDSDIEMID